MKKLFFLILAFATAAVSCSKDDSQADEILASIDENQVSLNGCTYAAEGYVSKDIYEGGGDYWIIDISGHSEKDGGGAHGILQGTFVGKDVDLAKVDCKELLFSITSFLPATDSEPSKEYGFRLNKFDGKVESKYGLDVWKDDIVDSGSCFKSGKISSSVTKDGKINVSVSGVLKDGSKLAIKISKTYEDRTKDM